MLVRASQQNAERVYRALASFGAPLSQFEVGEADFVTYDGVLQMGVPPLRIDILNRADGITFDEAIADGVSFELEGRKIPVIGRPALLKNKKAAGREQDVADVKALDQVVLSRTGAVDVVPAAFVASPTGFEPLRSEGFLAVAVAVVA